MKQNLDFSKLDGLLPVIVQEQTSGRVLMLGFMNEEAFAQTIESGEATFFSRSRGKLWRKGETSGHKLLVREIATDCDRDTLLLGVDRLGPGVCHEGYLSCFFRRLENGQWLESQPRTFEPSAVYPRP